MNRSLASVFAFATIVVLFGFPKAGVYLSKIPLTFGYVLLGLVGLMELVQIAHKGQLKFEKRYGWLGVILAALAIVEIASFAMYGTKSLGAAVSIVTSTLLMPVLGMLATHWMLRTLGIDGLLRSLRWALVPVLVFGTISFLAYNLGGKTLGIPFLTTTGSDITTVAVRHNLRGPIIKMFSTYNNGNILGINLLIWGPIVGVCATRCVISYRMLCVLTLSRSVWAGLIALEIVSALVHRSYRRIYQALVGAVILSVTVVVASWAIGRNPTEFLFDKDLGGRVTNLQNDLEVISSLRIGWDSESVPAAAWLAFGPVGLALLAIAWCIPIFSGGNSKVQVTARISLLVYLLVSIVEGAFTLVPTQAIYWFVAAIAMTSQETDLKDESSDESQTPVEDSVECDRGKGKASSMQLKSGKRHGQTPVAGINPIIEPVTFPGSQIDSANLR